MHQIDKAAACCFNQGLSLRLTGPLDFGSLERAVEALVTRHDGLRMRFKPASDAVTVLPPSKVVLPLDDLGGVADAEDAFAKLLADEAEASVDLVGTGPLRCRLVRFSDETHILLLTLHHAVCDGLSFNVIATELADLYGAFIRGETPGTGDVPSFATYIAGPGSAEVDAATSQFWKDQLAGADMSLDLPLDRRRPATQSFRAARTTGLIDQGLTAELRDFGAKNGLTLFGVLLGSLQIMLARLSGAEAATVAIPSGRRRTPDEARMIGNFVHLLPVRTTVSGEEPALDVLKRAADAALEAVAHDDMTLNAIQKGLGSGVDNGSISLTQVLLNLRRQADAQSEGGVTFEMLPNPKAASQFDLFFNTIESGDGLRIDVDFATDILNEDTVRRWISHWKTLLAALPRSAGTTAGQLPLLAAADIAEIDLPNRRSVREFDLSVSIPRLFSRQVASRPNAVAVDDGSAGLSYADLDRRSDALAALIQARLGMKCQRVGVAIPRGREMLVALLGVLKSGHTYVPLDPRQPKARLDGILATAEASAVVASDARGRALASDAISLIDPADAQAGQRPETVPHDPQAAAYVIFTSGSTGTPKGVEIPHAAAVNFLLSMAEAPGFGPSDTVLAVTKVMFDIALLELFLPLVTGGRVVIASDDDVADGFRLAERANADDITVLQATPTLWDMLLDAGLKPRSGLKMLAGGEPMPGDLADRLMRGGAELWNMYGPTETTVWSAVKRLQPGRPITIGAPVANTDLWVLDANDQPVPAGVTGELNIGGSGLANGYFGRDDLTGATFRDVDLPVGTRRLYRTGDMARLTPAGEVEVLGRRDGQIKLRGYRIELGDIETRLRAMPGIDKAAVALKTRSNGVAQLVAYVVAVQGTVPDMDALSRSLSEQLPSYMVPQGWVQMDALPQTANGKLERKALPDPADRAAPAEPAAAARPAQIVAPIRPAAASSSDGSTGLVDRISAIWATVLGLPDVAPDKSLFALGADSLTIFRIAAKMQAAGLKVDVRALLSTTGAQALAIEMGEAVQPARPSLADFMQGRARGREIAS